MVGSRVLPAEFGFSGKSQAVVFVSALPATAYVANPYEEQATCPGRQRALFLGDNFYTYLVPNIVALCLSVPTTRKECFCLSAA